MIELMETGKAKQGRWYVLKLNPFTDSIVSGLENFRGNYAIYVRKKLRYIGESGNLTRRISDHVLSFKRYSPNRQVRVVFKIRLEKKDERREVEKCLISRLSPPGNGKRKNSGIEKKASVSLGDIIITNEDFLHTRNFIKSKLDGKHGLADREERVLRMRFGLKAKKHPLVHTLQEAGNKLGVSRERIRQIEERALRKLKKEGMRELEKCGLSNRCVNCLEWGSIETHQELKQYVYTNGFERLFLIKNFGRKCMTEVENLLGGETL